MANQIRLKRRKINLLRSRKMGKKNMDAMVWFIGIKQNAKTFYIADYDDENNTIMWSISKKDSISFKTERAVHRFIKSHLRNRNDIFLIQTALV